MRRCIIFHYHLFKNAGTSVDKILQESFGDRWAEKEFDKSKKTPISKQVESWIKDTPDLSAYSSHTALMPLPEIPNTEVIPIIFIRHPLLRLYSAYSFERNQISENFGSKSAKKLDFAGYLEVRLSRPNDASARNFQARRLSCFFPESYGGLHKRACHSLAKLPRIGLVENFHKSMMRYEKLARQNELKLETFNVRENVSNHSAMNHKQRVDYIEDMLPLTLIEKFKTENKT
ncbi:MAG: sulfotransferase family 2 domain-containing protein, partial [Maricaulaceae bacterium]